ncbi:recombination protein NinB [uncultured Brevundimonas sp.]|uniref:recombination protein NinB n=1 Tax=uncultured Brevundimonas sp. TaxID=213418 RepID=UPI0026065343|nr:recombination protein NinB [uncultured Brevundimonas sp.]
MNSNNPCVIIRSNADRQRAALWASKAPDGTVVEFRQKNRSLDQNAAMWSILTQITKARPHHNGVKMSAVLWKAVFLQALKVELVMLPTLDGDGMFPFGHRSSKLTVRQMSDLIELMLAWAAGQGIEIKHFDGDQKEAA